MEKSNNKGVLVVGILNGIIIMLGVGIGLFATNTISFSNKCHIETDSLAPPITETYTYDQISGLYTFESDSFDDGYGNEGKVVRRLYLYKNGTFVYQNAYMINNMSIGNYTIVDNSIVLNKLGSRGSGTGIMISEKEELETISINEDGTLEDTSFSIKQLNMDSIKYTKVTSEEEINKWIASNEFFDFLNSDELYNKYTSKKAQ